MMPAGKPGYQGPAPMASPRNGHRAPWHTQASHTAESVRIGRQWIVVREPPRMFLLWCGHPGAHRLRRVAACDNGRADVATGMRLLPEAEHCAQGGPGRA